MNKQILSLCVRHHTLNNRSVPLEIILTTNQPKTSFKISNNLRIINIKPAIISNILDKDTCAKTYIDRTYRILRRNYLNTKEATLIGKMNHI